MATIDGVALPGHEGAFGLTLRDGSIATVTPAHGTSDVRWVALPGLVNLHAHADRCHTVQAFRPKSFADALTAVRSGATGGRLRITATNAFAARWLVPRLPNWRAAHLRLKLDIIGTDAVLDLRSGEVDVAIRYARSRPLDHVSTELARDTFHVVASPKLVGNLRKPLRPTEIARLPLIESEWPSTDPQAPIWQRWQALARSHHKDVPVLSRLASTSFREELHAIDAVAGGQGVAICSDVIVSNELRSGLLVKAHPLSLPGYGFYLVSMAHSPQAPVIEAFSTWMRAIS